MVIMKEVSMPFGGWWQHVTAHCVMQACMQPQLPSVSSQGTTFLYTNYRLNCLPQP